MAIGYTYDRSGGYRRANDCVPRAISALTGKAYKQTRQTVERWQERTRGKKSIARGTSDAAVRGACADYGLEEIRLPAGTTVREAGESYPNALIWIHRHLTAVVGGTVRDTWDTRDKKAKSVWVKRGTPRTTPNWNECGVRGCHRRAVRFGSCDLPRHICDGCGIGIASPNCKWLKVDCGDTLCDLCY